MLQDYYGIQRLNEAAQKLDYLNRYLSLRCSFLLTHYPSCSFSDACFTDIGVSSTVISLGKTGLKEWDDTFLFGLILNIIY